MDKGLGEGVTGPTTPRTAGPCCGGEYYPYTIVSKNLETIAIIPQQEDGIMDANARLIAAAPEMYEVLKEVFPLLGGVTREKARKVLEKIEQQQNFGGGGVESRRAIQDKG